MAKIIKIVFSIINKDNIFTVSVQEATLSLVSTGNSLIEGPRFQIITYTIWGVLIVIIV